MDKSRRHTRRYNRNFYCFKCRRSEYVLTSGSTGNINGDGYADIFIGTTDFHPNELWINNQNNTFTLSPSSALIGGTSLIRSAVMGDFNGDGKTDIYAPDVGNFSGHYLYLGDGAGNFTMANVYPHYSDSLSA